MNSHAGDIPAELLFDLSALRPVLERNGVVQLHHGTDRQPSYRLRFREFDSRVGYIRQRSIPLGHNPVVVQAVAELVRRWRDEYQPGGESTKSQPSPQATPPSEKQSDPALKLAQELCGGGWRRRDQIAKWYNEALGDPAEMMKFNLTGAFPGVRKGGRPLKKRTW